MQIKFFAAVKDFLGFNSFVAGWSFNNSNYFVRKGRAVPFGTIKNA